MGETLRLGHIAGVRVGVNWSVIVIFLLITFGLAAGRFPVLVPDLPTGAYLAAGLAAAVVFLASLLAHEISHAIVARRNGVGVEGITLWMFGGVARLQGDAQDPGADLRIAGVGPLVSLVLGVMFGALAVTSDAVGGPPLVTDALTWLGVINVALAVFNLVPAAPLDGGRILRAFLWRLWGDRFRAAIAATRAGKFFGFLLVGLGLFSIVTFPGFGGLWLMLIGWFIAAAAGAEEQQTRTRAQLSDVSVADVMTKDPTTAPAWLTVGAFVEDYVFRHHHSTFPLVDHYGQLAGLVTLRRVKQVPRDEWSTIRLRDIACTRDEVATARPDESLPDVLERMASCADGRVVVVDGDRLVGILSPADVTRRMEIADLRRAADSHHH
jgi:Zn-dependent protease